MPNPSQPLILYSRAARWGMTHCACAVDGVARGERPLPAPAGLWTHPAGLVRLPLPQEHQVFFNPTGAAGVVVLNRAAQAVWERYAGPRPLEDETARRLAALDLLQAEGATPAPPRSPVLTAWLHITNACNLRCTYCFVRKSDEAMDEATGEAALQAVFGAAVSHGFQAVKLKYAGGEPTLHFGLLRRLHDRAAALGRQYGLDVEEVIISNGVALTGAMLDFIRQADMTLSISLDGLDGGHDRQRVFANGRGSAEHVLRGIERALAHGVRPHLSVTVTRHNVESLPEVVRFALERQLYFNLNLYQEHEPGVHHDELRAANEALIAGLRRALEVIAADLPRYNVFTALLDRTNLAGPHAKACGVGENYLVMDHRGRVSRCQMELDRPVTAVGAGDVLHHIHLYEDAAPFRNLSVETKADCRDCPWRYVCAGGCSLMTYRSFGRSDVASPYCAVYQALLPEILRLEGLRLLRWGAEAM
ncbi:MAG: radical SAM protein [Anaerolineae bacterium]|nr:radical SAM protein [Anaerolineae bacterium]